MKRPANKEWKYLRKIQLSPPLQLHILRFRHTSLLQFKDFGEQMSTNNIQQYEFLKKKEKIREEMVNDNKI